MIRGCILKRKFVTEYSIGYLNSYTGMITAHQLMNADKMTPKQNAELAECHIYAITAIPSSYFKQHSLKHDANGLSGCLCYKIEGVEKEIEFQNFPWVLDDNAVSIDCKYPFKEVISYDANGKECAYIPANYLSSVFLNRQGRTELNDYEVLYIGQAIGNTGNRTAIDRLSSHATLQKILAKTAYDYPDKEIVIFMYEFKHENMFSSMDGRAVQADNSSRNEERLFNAIENPPNKKQKIGLIEAGLIRYFQPPYNKIFTIKFPSTKHKTLISCYELDISGFVVEINCENLNYYLHSDSVKSSHHHIAKIDLFNSIDRSSFFSPTEFKVAPDVIV